MAKRRSPSKGKEKGAGKRRVRATVPQDVRIKVCDDQKHGFVKHYIVWTNTESTPCQVDFNINGCPLDHSSFTVPAGSPSDPGTFPTKVLGPGGGQPYQYTSSCCKLQVGGNPVVIVD